MDSNVCGIYQITNLINGRVYVGSSINVRRRWQRHVQALKKGVHGNKFLQRAWESHGEMAFSVTVLELVDDRANLLQREQYWMDKLNVTVDGYNMLPTAGSALGMKHTEEHKAYISALYKGKPNGRDVTQETRQRLSQANKGRKMSLEFSENLSSKLKGREITPEWRAKLSEAKLGKPGPKKSDETRAKLSAALKGRPVSEEKRAAISATLKGKMKGVPKSPETRQRMKEAQAKRRAKIS